MKIELRGAESQDAQLVYDVTKATMRSYVEKTFGPWIESFQREVIGQSFDSSTHRVVLVDGQVAGILAAPVHETHIQLEKIYLLPSFQRRGIGSRLVRELQESAKIQHKPIRLRVLAVNKDAQRLYERLGFVVRNVTPERIFMEYHA